MRPSDFFFLYNETLTPSVLVCVRSGVATSISRVERSATDAKNHGQTMAARPHSVVPTSLGKAEEDVMEVILAAMPNQGSQ